MSGFGPLGAGGGGGGAIAADAVTTTEILDGTIVNADIANGTINLATKVTGSLLNANAPAATKVVAANTHGAM